jgi:hypothetical protein
MMQTLLANLRLWTGRLAGPSRPLSGRWRVPRDQRPLRADAGAGAAEPGAAGLGKKADARRGVEEAISLGKGFGELGMALQAAGVAMHLGMGEQALTLAEQDRAAPIHRHVAQ